MTNLETFTIKNRPSKPVQYLFFHPSVLQNLSVPCFFWGLNSEQLTALHNMILSFPDLLMPAFCRVEKNNSKGLLSAIHNTGGSHGHQRDIRAMIPKLLFSPNLAGVWFFYYCALSSCGEIAGLQYRCSRSLWCSQKTQVRLTESLQPHSLSPITWLDMVLRYLWYRCFCLWLLFLSHLCVFPLSRLNKKNFETTFLSDPSLSHFCSILNDC